MSTLPSHTPSPWCLSLPQKSQPWDSVMEKEVRKSPHYVCSKDSKPDRKEVECKLVW